MTERLVSLALALMMVMALALPVALAEDNSVDPRAGYYYVKTDNGKGLNVRNAPGSGSSVIGSLKYGTRIHVDAFTTPDWALILYRYDNGYGLDYYAAWVSTRYLTRTNPGKYQGSSSANNNQGQSSNGAAANSLSALNDIFRTAKQVDAPYTVVARPSRASGWVNLRWAPSTDAQRIATCPQGKTLTVLAEMKGWYQVKDPVTGMIGFISSKYVSRQ